MRFRNIVGAAVCVTGLLNASPVFGQLQAVPYVSGLSLPVAFVQDPGDSTIQYVVQQGGRIRLIRNGVLQTTDFLNLTSSIISGGEQGLLGLAFAPDYVTSRRFFVNFTNTSGHTVVARFMRSSTNPLVADPTTRLDLLWSTGARFITQPFANHNGGNIVFGPDGFLYIGMGDGGSGNDPQHLAQDPTSLLGKMLRIDVVSVPDSNTAGFVVPADNPFRTSSRPEIWSFGLRNPWRFSFDDPARGGTGAMVIADVGQSSWEEVDYEPANRGGLNYGWRNREGAHNNVTSLLPAFFPLVDPIHEYDHSVGGSITGGYVYRGSALGASYAGRYFFGDFVSGRIWSIALTINPSTGAATASDLIDHTSELSSASVSTFGVDASGELYFLNYGTGRIMRIESALTAPATITSIAPAGGSVAGGTGVTITGTNFRSGAAVSLGGVAPTSVVVSDATTITAVTGAHAAGVVDVVVTNPGAQAATRSGAFTYRIDAAAPVGSFDSPANGSTGIAGSVAVSGWALDDVQVTRLAICRDAVAGESAPAHPACNGLAQIFIGDAVFIPGARPDVQAAFPGTPFNARAGWGYLLLSNFLPNLGTGTVVLYAYASDADGHTTPLGTKTITCANDTSVAPFGALDTPNQGEAIGGTAYNNFGWALSPGARRADVPGGGTVQVLIDGVNVGTPGGWVARSDLTALFPAAQYSGVGNAAAAFTFDTTAFADGLHSIAWVVTATSGGTSGIGSRFFTISNGSGVVAEATQFPSSWLAPSGGSILGRRGFDLSAPYRTYAADRDGRITIAIEELDRLELDLAGGDGQPVTGHLRTVDGLAPLPAGSTVDRSTGRFTWMPGAGFIGTYDLVFARGEGAGARHDVRVVLSPRGRNRDGPQVVIDVADGHIVTGWAADLQSRDGTGVDAIHVWAYPANGGAPIFVGAADYGGARPDVAAIYGERFRKSGYGLRVEGLAPGTYDLAVFAYSTVSGGFAPAKVVRVTIR